VQNPPPLQNSPPVQHPSPVQNPPPPTPEQQKAHEAEMQRQLDMVRSLQKQADDARAAREREERRRAAPPQPPTTPPQPKRATPPSRVAVDLGAAGIFGVGPSNPDLVGGDARVVYSRALLRAGASLSLTGMRETLAGAHDLSFFRALVAARAGIGVRAGIVELDVTAGPALLILVEDAHAEGRHAVASLAFVAGPRLSLALAGPLAIVAGADIDVAITDEKVTAGGARVAEFSRPSVDVMLGLSWRSR
jgi:hypothetical protein